MVTFSRPRKWLFLLVQLCDHSENHHSLKSLFIIDSKTVWSRSKKIGPIFHKLHLRTLWVSPALFYIYNKCLKGIHYTKAVVPNPLLSADRSMLDNFTATREYSCNNVSMGRIDRSHAEKPSGVTTSTHFVISQPGDCGPLP